MRPHHIFTVACFFQLLLATSVLQAQTINASSKKIIDSLEKENAYLKGALKIQEAIKEAENDDISFKIIRVQGNKAAQTITVEVLLTNSGPDVNTFYTSIHSIIDAEGNEYPISKYSLGSKTGDRMSFLTTKLFKGVPFKCSYTFSGADKSPLLIKRLSFPYRAGRDTNGNAQDGQVFFSDLPVIWK